MRFAILIFWFCFLSADALAVASQKSAPQSAGLYIIRPKAGFVTGSGDLLANRIKPYGGIELSLFRRFTSVDPFVSLEFSRMDATTRKVTPFPFKSSEPVYINSFGYQVGICLLGNRTIRICPAIGQAILDIAGSKSAQTYGAFQYGMKLEYSFYKNLVATSELNTQMVSQKFDGRSSWGKIITANLGVGILFK